MILKYIEAIRITLMLAAGVICLPLSAQDDKGVVVDRIIAKVDDKIILQSELEEAYLQFLSSGQVNAGTSKCNIFESLIINKLLVAKAEIDSVVVLDPEVDQNLDQRMQMILSQVGGNEQALEDYYDKSLVDIRNELRESVKEQLIVQRMQNTITSDISVTPAEVQAFFSKIPRDSLPYFSAEVSIGQIVKVPEIGKDVKNRARGQLLEYKKRIEAGESFEALARQYSQGPSAPNGGNLGYQQRGGLVPPYEAAALSLKPGEISDPVESEFGFHLIQLISRRGNEYDSRHILLQLEPSTKDIEKAEVYLDSLRTLIVEDSMAFEKVAKEYSDEQLTADNGGFMIGDTGSPYVPTDKLDFETFLTLDTMKLGTITHTLDYQTQEGKKAVRIIYYKDRIRPHQANLLDDYQKIATAALAEKKNRILNSWFDEARNDVFIRIDEEFNNCQILQ
jgi:peptidyl-prolyl cis-trans isomerase SurA